MRTSYVCGIVRNRVNVLTLLMVTHGLLLAASALIHSPTIDECSHLPSGYVNWQGRFDAYRVNPPLVRMVAAVPLLISQPDLEFITGVSTGTFRAEYYLGFELFHHSGREIVPFFILGRLCCIPFSVCGLYVCYTWTSRMLSKQAGLIAATMWCFCPDFLGHGSLITPDVPAATAGVCLGFALWKWLGDQRWTSCIYLGLSLSFCVLTKFTWIGFCGVLPVAILFWKSSLHALPRRLLQVIAVCFILLYFVNAQYQFSGVGHSLKSLQPVSSMFQGLCQVPVLSDLPLPVPKDVILGIDVQRGDFESQYWSYFCGTWRQKGWWNYYLVGILLKLPITCWLMFSLGVAAIVARVRNRTLEPRTVVALSLPPIVILSLISTQTGFNHHIRYAIPAYPFIFIAAAAAFDGVKSSHIILRKRTCLTLLTGFVASSLFVYPHSLSYFSWICGGPANGHYYFINSNVDWGQDVFLIEYWKRTHPNIHVDGYELVYPTHLVFPDSKPPPLEPTPGWYIVSVDHLHSNDINTGHSYFLRYKPYARIGWSANVYHVPHAVAE
jgi:ABC-type nitrate/sulfonate/bicarbonate transport system permease component